MNQSKAFLSKIAAFFQRSYSIFILAPLHPDQQQTGHVPPLIDNRVQILTQTLEREYFHEHLRKVKIEEEVAKVHKTLLSSVSHELKTPLAAISAASSALSDPHVGGIPETQRELVQQIEIGSKRMLRLIQNLLDMGRIESGMVRLRLSPCNIHDILANVFDFLTTTMALER